jgi:AraC family ethanolamine operon transcriptional activator
MTLQNPTHHLWSIKQVNLGGIDLQCGQLGSGNMVEGQSWQNGYLLYIPLSQTCEYRINGSGFTSKEFMVLEPGAEFCLSTKAPHDWSTLFVPTGESSNGDGFSLPSFGARTSKIPRAYVAREKYETLTRLRSIVTQILAASGNSSQFEHSHAAEIARADLLHVFNSAVGGNRAKENNRIGRPKVSRMQIVWRCKDFAQAHAEKYISGADLARAAEVSERTLRSAFNEYFGVPPTKYLQLRQLHKVRATLQKTDPANTKVADILVQHGVWEIGRFALRYRQLFGELPSKTLS